MAQVKTLREFLTRLHAMRDRLPVDCVLCRRRCPGGLCEYCRAAVCESVRAGGPRCPRCDVALAGVASAGTGGCPDCATQQPAFDRVVAAFDYAWPGDLLIQRLKLQGRFHCAPMLAGLLAERCELLGRQGFPLWNDERTLVAAVPSSRRSITLRGYNPAAEVGRALAHRLPLEWRPGLLRRTREGRHQKGLGRRARQAGVEDLYECVVPVHDREIVVVDDVMTTGSTLSACARVLKEAGARKVYGAVVARTPRRSDGGASL